MKIKTDDGAIGRSLKTTATKTDDSDETVCEIKAQLTVKRAEIDWLAGFPADFAAHFYSEDGAPIANMELRLPKRELGVSGKLWRGDDEHASTLVLKKATADSLRFKLEPNGAVLICRISWRAAGDEIEEVKDLLGKWCSVELTFSDPLSKQAKLQLAGGGKAEKGAAGDAHLQTDIEGSDGGELPGQTIAPKLAARLEALGIHVPESGEFWFTVSDAQRKQIEAFAEARESGDTKAKVPAVLKPFQKKTH